MGAFVSPWPALVPEGHAGEVDAIATGTGGGLRAGYAHPRGWPAKPNDTARPDQLRPALRVWPRRWTGRRTGRRTSGAG